MPNKTSKKASRNAPEEIDDYLEVLPESVRDELSRIREIVKSMVPEVTERIGYQIPIFRAGQDLIGMAFQKKYCSLYTMSHKVIDALSTDLTDYDISGTTIHFTTDQPLGEALIRKIILKRLEEIKNI